MTGELVQSFGVPIAALMAIGYATYRAVRYVGTTLLEHPTGLLTRLVSSHIEFLNQFNGALKSTTKALEEIATLLADLRDMREQERKEMKVLLDARKDPP